jgi:hypothetical protein
MSRYSHRDAGCGRFDAAPMIGGGEAPTASAGR